MFNPTHTFHYADGSNNKRTWPNGIPVMRGFTDTGSEIGEVDGLIEWLADEEGNVAGYSYENDTFIVPIQ